MSDIIYLDHAALTPPCRSAIDAFAITQSYAWGNPNSTHAVGEKARDVLENARQTMLRLLGASKGDTLVFTSGASESAALAIKSMEDNCTIVALNSIDHHCVTEYPLTPMKVEKSYEYGLAQMLWNNETGERLPNPKLPKNSLWACDITAGVGHAPFSFKDFPTMSYAWGSAQKFGGITGVGFLLVRRGTPLSQMIYGAPNRGGTPAVPLAYAMAAALEWNVNSMEKYEKHFARLNGAFITQLVSRWGDKGYRFNLPNESADEMRFLPHIMNINFDGVDGKTLAMMLSRDGVMISAGAACTSGDNAPSYVLMNMYHDEKRARSAVRISFGTDNTVEEVEHAAKKICECVEHLRSIG